MKQTEQEFKEIINALALLKTTKPDDAFRARMEHKAQRTSPVSGRFAMPLFAAKIALVVLLVLLSGNSMVSVASESKPGEALYPVKQLVDSVKTTFTSEQTITQAPSPQPQKHMQQKTPATGTNSQSPTPIDTGKQQPLPAATITIMPNQPTATPTPKPAQQGVLPAVHNTVSQVLQTVPAIGGAPQPTPLPHSLNEGSKDNGSDAGAGGSLLPKLKIGPLF